MQYHFVQESLIAGILASLACGLGVLPLALRRFKIENHIGFGYAFAGGLMFSASVYNLLLPALTSGTQTASKAWPVIQVILGVTAGCFSIWGVHKFLTPERLDCKFLKPLGGRVSTLVFIAMAFHSIPEGVAVGVGYASEAHLAEAKGLGTYIAVAIGIHNIPEGLAVAIPLRLQGVSLFRCFFLAFLTSLPQPIASVPAAILVGIFQPLMLPFLGFAAGAMMYLVLMEIIPDALEHIGRTEIAWFFMAGFCFMALVQIGL